MAFQVSPGVNVSEVDLSTVVPAVSTTEGAIAGVFKWGPVDTRVLVDSEESLPLNVEGSPSKIQGGRAYTFERYCKQYISLYYTTASFPRPNHQ